jgi:hypothetical protein
MGLIIDNPRTGASSGHALPNGQHQELRTIPHFSFQHFSISAFQLFISPPMVEI